ncbi:MAG: DUF2169 domain-containing protein [Polyangiaceae bacterium]
MRVQNLTGFLAGTKVGSRNPPQPEMTVLVRATFVLRPGEPLRVPEGEYPLSQGTLSGDLFGEHDDDGEGEVHYPSDFADHKPRADVMLRGKCFSPKGRPVRDLDVRFSVARWSKTLRVPGPDKRGAPVTGFGPVHPDSPLRKDKLGKEYGQSYQEQRAPYYAEDFDYGYFNAAPPDQQIEGYLRGDEDLTFGNLHATAASFKARLPGLRIRAFALAQGGRFREVPMRLDTLFADLDAERLYLTWRGITPVAEDDLTDVSGLLVAEENLADPPKPEHDYHVALTAYLEDPQGLSTAAPPALRDAFSRMRKGQSPASPDGQAPTAAAANPISKLLSDKLGGLLPAQQAQVRAALSRAMGVPLPPGTDLGAAMADMVSKLPKTAPVGAPAPGAAPRVPALTALRDMASRASAAEQRAGQPLPGLSKVNDLLTDPRLVAMAPGVARTGPEPPAVAGADLSGLDLRNRDLRGADLEGANLSGALLSGANLRGAVLRGASLEGAVLFEADCSAADFTGANLTRANLSAAIATDARFTSATLDSLNATGAKLDGALFEATLATAAVLERADLTRARFPKARLLKCVLDEVIAEAADFTGAELVGTRFLGAKAPSLIAERALLDGTTFEGAHLQKARFGSARGEKTVFISADLDGADFRFSVLRDAHFEGATARGATFRAADLMGARFYRAILEESYFVEARISSADFRKATLVRARLSGAMAWDAKLAGADTRGMDDTGTFFGHAEERNP